MIRIWALTRLFDQKERERKNSSIADEKGEEKNWKKKKSHFFTQQTRNRSPLVALAVALVFLSLLLLLLLLS